MPCGRPTRYASGVSAAAWQLALERANGAKLREIDAHRRAIILQDKTAAFFDGLGLETRAAVARERGERARAMLELAFIEQAHARSFTAAVL